VILPRDISSYPEVVIDCRKMVKSFFIFTGFYALSDSTKEIAFTNRTWFLGSFA